jgi:hypothetical protein
VIVGVDLPDRAIFAKEVRQVINNGVKLGGRRYTIKSKDQRKVQYYAAHPQKWFFLCELYDLLKQIWNLDQVTSSMLRQLWNQNASAHCHPALRDTCQFSAMGNLLVHFKYATHSRRGNANVYRKRIG